MSSLDIDIPDLGAILRDLQATEGQVDRALKSTLRKMASWLRVRAMRGLSEKLQLQQKILRRRLKTFKMRKTRDGDEIRVFFGMDDVALIHLGARKTSSGVTAGKHKAPGAFIARGKGGSQQVFKRTGSARLPIKKQVLEIADKSQVYIEDNLLGTDDFDAQFLRTFEHEINWQMR